MTPRSLLIPALLLSITASLGCSDDARLTLSTHWESQSQSYPEVAVTIRKGAFKSRAIELDANHQRVGPFDTDTSGTLHLEFVLLHDQVPSTTSGSIDLALRGDWGWGVSFDIRDFNPEEACFGCFGSKEFELDPALGFDPTMKLYVLWGGNSISNPVEY